MASRAFIQVGANVHQGVVKVRAPDEKSPDGYVVQCLAPVAARTLADWLEDGVPGKVLKISDGKRWAEHELDSATLSKIAADLRRCADDIDRSSNPRPS